MDYKEFIPIKREVDADNSCLFSSIAYLLDKDNFDENSSFKFRQIIINHLYSSNFDLSLLDKSKDEYIHFIDNPNNWGGALEIKMFSDIFKIQINCFDIRNNKFYFYGENQNFNQMIFLLYNGFHYDPIVLNFNLESDPITDITIFNTIDNNIFNIMKSFYYNYKEENSFELFSLQCLICLDKFNNENQAYEHSINFNHWNFSNI